MSAREAAEAIRRSFLSAPAPPEFVFEKLGHLDAGRAVDAIHGLAHHAARLREELARAGGEGAAAGVGDLMQACVEFEGRYGWAGQPVNLLPHIGWGDVVDTGEDAYLRYGFQGTGSFEVFEDLLRYLSGACCALAEIYALAMQTLGELAGSGAVCSLARDTAEWRSAGEALEHTAQAMREIRGRSDDFAERRELAKQRAASESSAAVARLLELIANVRSRWAWLSRAPGSRMLECATTGSYRVRVRFADGLTHEIELGEEFWSTTGHRPDAEEFRAVVLDRERNCLAWTNGVEVPGERLHLAIVEGRL